MADEQLSKKGFRLPKKFAVMRFPETEWEGLEVRVKLDTPLSLFMEIQDMVDAQQHLKVFKLFGDSILVEWNLEDADGTPLPANGKGLEAITPYLARQLIENWLEAVGNLPGPLGQPSVNGNGSRVV